MNENINIICAKESRKDINIIKKKDKGSAKKNIVNIIQKI